MLAGPDAAKCEWAARTHGETPERDVAEGPQQLLGEIRLADRNAARGQHHVGAGCGAAQGGFERGGFVAHHAEVERLDVQPPQHRKQRVAIAVVHAARVERLAERAQFVAGRKKCDAQTPPHAALRRCRAKPANRGPTRA